MSTTRVLVVSQQLLLRQGIEHSLVSTGQIEVVGSVDVSDAALPYLDTLPPDVAVVDIDDAHGSALGLARRIRQRSPSISVVLLTATLNDEQLFQAIKVQASACLDKETSTEQLIEIVQRVALGEHPINETLGDRPRVAEKVLSQFQKLSWRNDSEDIMSPLTPREIEILDYVAKGYLNKQIAIELGISEQTIKNHVTSILRKLNANARTEAVVLAIKQGVISIA
ncbi:MAG: response regulator transcription factor [Dehalococcoidales bacterium]